MSDLSTIKLYATQPHDCSYLESETATTVFVDPALAMNAELYQQLSELGFRRSGNHVYRPHCQQCQACVPARIPVKKFTPNRNQKRCRKRNSDITVNLIDSIDTPEHYGLYEHYIANRHHDGDMYPATEAQFGSFLTKEWGITRYLEMRLDNQLIGVAVTDEFSNALSAIYTYFDPALHQRSLGTLGVLLQIERAQSLGLKYVYLGYWIKNCQKMSYKTLYRPLELLVNRRWTLLS